MLLVWTGFILFIILLLLLDLGILNRRPHAISMREAMRWSALWIALGVAFCFVIYDGYAHHRFGQGAWPDAIDGRLNDGPTAAAKYLAGYVLEKALSVDNLFVIAVIFRFLAVPAEQQHRVLLWGILGAMVMRGLMIGVGVELIRHYHWVLYVFGGFLLLTGLRLLILPEHPPDPAHNIIVRLARRFLPLTPRYHGGRFLTWENGRRVLTPLALALVLIETGDAVFAVDSIPAVFGVTADPLLVYTSNIMALLGLRALYFALAGLLDRFHYLKVSLALILLLVGGKMLASHWIHPLLGQYAVLVLLGLVALVLGAGVVASLAFPSTRKDIAPVPNTPAETTAAGS
ncbi:MAG TPA: TerC/Alx family metal homeostasis membrane protein [Tepidisphaeraceae bacterium]|jgi:tellurite resistance protein TerC